METYRLYMRYLALLIGCLHFSLAVFGQNNRDYTEMLQDAESMLYNQPQESIKISEHLIQNSQNIPQLIDAFLVNAGAHYAMGEYNEAAKALIEAKKLAEDNDEKEMQVKINISSIHLLNHLGMDIVAEEYYLRTLALSDKLTNGKISYYRKGGNKLILAYKNLEKDDPQQALENFTEADSLFEHIQNPILQTETTAAIFEVYLKATDLASAQNYFQSVLQNTEGIPLNNFLKMIALSQLGKLQFQKKEYSASLSSYKNALAIAEQLNNNSYKSILLEGLSTTFLAMDNASNFSASKMEGDRILNEVEKEEEDAVNSIYNYINENNNAKSNALTTTYRRNILILAIALFLIFCTWLALRYRYNNRIQQYKRFMAYFEKKQNEKETVISKEMPKTSNIPKETENVLVQKLNQFENSKHFTKQEMSLAMLASHFDTNTKYLSEVINTHKNQNFNSYINELRINYIIDKLQNNRTYQQYKISYLAEESGFSSHSSFATVFKNVTGIPPTAFIDMVKTTKKTKTPVYEDAE